MLGGEGTTSDNITGNRVSKSVAEERLRLFFR